MRTERLDRLMKWMIVGVAFIVLILLPTLEAMFALQGHPFWAHPPRPVPLRLILVFAGLGLYGLALYATVRNLAAVRAQGLPEWPAQRGLLGTWAAFAAFTGIVASMATSSVGWTWAGALYLLALVNYVFVYRYWRRHRPQNQAPGQAVP